MDEKSNWARAHDMRLLQEHIEKQEFKALSPGIGLGPKKSSHGMRVPNTPKVRPSQVRTVEPVPAKGSEGSARSLRSERLTIGVKQHASGLQVPANANHLGPSWGMRLQAYLVDFFLVVSTLTVAFAGVTVYIAAGEHRVHDWWQLQPVQLLARTSPLVTLGVVYGVFLVYAIFFKFLVGSTCGESLLGISTKIGSTMVMAKQKNF